MARWRGPGPTADKNVARERRVNTVLVIGGGVAGTQTAVEMARMGHAVELVEQRPFLGGARRGSAWCFPPTIAASACRRRTPRPARASASIATSPSTTPTSISGAVRWWSPSPDARGFQGRPASTAKHRHHGLHQLRHLRRRSAANPTAPGRARRSTRNSMTAGCRARLIWKPAPSAALHQHLSGPSH